MDLMGQAAAFALVKEDQQSLEARDRELARRLQVSEERLQARREMSRCAEETMERGRKMHAEAVRRALGDHGLDHFLRGTAERQRRLLGDQDAAR